MRPSASTLFAIVLLVALVATPIAVITTYMEDFFTTTYKDAVNTTAVWDTGAGELRLPPFQPSLTGNYDTAGFSYRLDVAGDFAIVTNNNSDASIIDISNLSLPMQVGTLNTLNFARGVAIAGDYAYVADGFSGLQVYDITTLAGVHNSVGAYDTGGLASDVVLAGKYAYLATGSDGLIIVDINDPTTPTLAGTYNTAGDAQGVFVSGDHAYVADDANGLEIIDISDPTTPVLAGNYNTSGSAGGVVVDGNHAFVADGTAGLVIVDVTDPTSPVLSGSHDTSGDAQSVSVSGDIAYVADGVSGLQVIDISDVSNPTPRFTFDTSGNARGVVALGGQAFVGDDVEGLQIIRVASIGATPAALDEIFVTGASFDTFVAGNLLYGAHGNGGLEIVDITDPANLMLVATYDTPGYARGVAVNGDIAAVADTDSLVLVDVSDPTNPVRLGAIVTTQSEAVFVDGDYAFVAQSGTVGIFDISNPASPTLVAVEPVNISASDVFVDGNLMYVADAYGFRVVDVTDVTNPTSLYADLIAGSGLAVYAAGDLAFLVSSVNSGTLSIYDVSDPMDIVAIGSYSTFSIAQGISVAGDYALLLTGELRVLDVSNPYSPILIAQHADYYTHAVLSGDIAYTSSGSRVGAVKIFDREFDASQSVAQSLTIDTTFETQVAGRISSTTVGKVSWDLSANNGTSWVTLDNEGAWVPFANVGSNVRWRARLGVSVDGIAPTVSHLQVDYMDRYASIASVADVPNDQGGQVRVYVERSGLDLDGAEPQATAYDVYRRVVPVAAPAIQSQLRAEQPTYKPGVQRLLQPEMRAGVAPRLEGVDYDTKGFVTRAPTGTFPSGTWEAVGSFGALQQDSYIAVVPTLTDSSNTLQYTSYVVVTRTISPSVWYVSAPDSGYSVDNIAPGVPEGFMLTYNTGSGNQLDWQPSSAPDFQYFRVYRSLDPDFVPQPGDLVHATTDTGWLDTVPDGWQYHYKITALDYVGNESDPASAETVTGTGGSTVPSSFALRGNIPNPFNPTTVIRYDVPVNGASVTLRVYDVAGRLVRTLVDGIHSAGAKTVGWDGRDDRGTPVASGVYYYRMQAGTFSRTRSMVLLK